MVSCFEDREERRGEEKRGRERREEERKGKESNGGERSGDERREERRTEERGKEEREDQSNRVRSLYCNAKIGLVQAFSSSSSTSSSSSSSLLGPVSRSLFCDALLSRTNQFIGTLVRECSEEYLVKRLGALRYITCYFTKQ